MQHCFSSSGARELESLHAAQQLGALDALGTEQLPQGQRPQLLQRVAGVAQRGRVRREDALRGRVQDEGGGRPLLEGGDVGLVVAFHPAGRGRAQALPYEDAEERTNKAGQGAKYECQLGHTSVWKCPNAVWRKRPS